MTWLSKFKFRTKMASSGEAEVNFLSKNVNSFPKQNISFLKFVINKNKSSLLDNEQSQLTEKANFYLLIFLTNYKENSNYFNILIINIFFFNKINFYCFVFFLNKSYN